MKSNHRGLHGTQYGSKTGSTTRAAYAFAYNRAGLVLSEDSTINGDPANGSVTYGYDPLGRITGSTLAGTATTYGWDATVNRTSVKVGAAPAATTTYDAANRPVSGANPAAAYTSDADGRLTARPGQSMTWDHLGRLASVTTAAGTTAYTYDPLDRLRTVASPDGSRTRFRYTGLTTSAAQQLDDVAGTVTRNIANGWTGERLADWTGSGSDRRYHGTNAHHDTTWLASDTGEVLASLRYDPWGTPRSAVPDGYTPFRFQGSWHDAGTDLAWVVTRWYAPSLGRFISEDTLLGEPRDPDSRHLYAYGAGEPVGSWDPDGTMTVLVPWQLQYQVVESISGRNSAALGIGWILACVGVGKLYAPVGGVCAAVDIMVNLRSNARGEVKHEELRVVQGWAKSSPGLAAKQEMWFVTEVTDWPERSGCQAASQLEVAEEPLAPHDQALQLSELWRLGRLQQETELSYVPEGLSEDYELVGAVLQKKRPQ